MFESNKCIIKITLIVFFVVRLLGIFGRVFLQLRLLVMRYSRVILCNTYGGHHVGFFAFSKQVCGCHSCFSEKVKSFRKSESMKLIHRYEVNVVSGRKGRANEKPSRVMTSFYRQHLDSAYQKMISDMMDYGRFDNFISSVIRSLVIDGKLFFV